MNDFEQSTIDHEQPEDFPGFKLPSNFDDLNFNQKRGIIERVADQAYGHLYSKSLDPRMDTEEFKSVLGDLIANSVDATKWSKREIQVRASRVDEEGKPRVVIEISDNGPGFPVEKLGQDLSAPIGTTRTVQGNLGGQGSGLHYCNLSVNKSGGKLSYGNREEGGAFVKLELPAYNKFDGTSHNTVYRVR